MTDFDEFIRELTSTGQSLALQLTSVWVALQIALLLLAALTAAILAAAFRKRTDLVSLTMGWPAYPRLLVRALVDNLGMLFFLLIVAVMRVALVSLTLPSRSYLLLVVANLAAAWVVITLIAGVIRNRFIYRIVAFSAWTIAALSILGLLEPTADALNSVAFSIGGLRLSALLVIKTLVLLSLALWAAVVLSDFLDKRMHNVRDLTPSLQVLIGKFVRLLLITVAVLVVLSSAGIDFSALAIFSGAVGVGVGLGLQKIVSNFVSGIVLLTDKSIKPGDVISVGGSYGWVSAMNTRCITVATRDGREVLIPNEDLVTQKVVNWSYSKDEIRVDVAFPVDVANDPHLVRRIAVEAVMRVPRVIGKPAPACHFVGFSAKSLDFLLRFWISDPSEGMTNIRGAVWMALWDAFQREGITIPSPIQDVRLRETAQVKLHNGDGADESASNASPTETQRLETSIKSLPPD